MVTSGQYDNNEGHFPVDPLAHMLQQGFLLAIMQGRGDLYRVVVGIISATCQWVTEQMV